MVPCGAGNGFWGKSCISTVNVLKIFPIVYFQQMENRLLEPFVQAGMAQLGVIQILKSGHLLER